MRMNAKQCADGIAESDQRPQLSNNGLRILSARLLGDNGWRVFFAGVDALCIAARNASSILS
jgi:hypothetical protein